MPESGLGQTRRLLSVDAAEDQKEERREEGSKCFKGVTDVVLNWEGPPPRTVLLSSALSQYMFDLLFTIQSYLSNSYCPPFCRLRACF